MANLALKKKIPAFWWSVKKSDSKKCIYTHPAQEAKWRRRENIGLCICGGVCEGPRGRASVLTLSRCFWSNSQQPRGSKTDRLLQRLITEWCCGCLAGPWYLLPAAPPALAAPCAPTYGHHRTREACASGLWLVCTSQLGGYCSADSPCLIPPFQKLHRSYAQSNGISLSGILGEWCSLSVGSVSLGMVFWRSFPTLVNAGGLEAPLKEIPELCGCFPQLIVLEGLWCAP